MSTNASEVYTGVWINHARGPLMGATLTLSSQAGAYLIAFLALLVQVVGTFFWNLVCYVVFEVRSRSQGDGLHFQQQAILRNAGTDTRAIRFFISAGFAWRKSQGTSRPLSRNLGYALLALTNLVAFLLAGIFSSRVTATTSEVLLRPQLCGDFELFGRFGYSKNTTRLSTKDLALLMDAYRNYITQPTEPSALYATSCQSGKAQNGYCAPITRQNLDYSPQTISDCPFQDGICSGSTLTMDTGMVDSLLHFGINSKHEDRVSLKWTAECSPLERQDYATEWLPGNDSLITWASNMYDYNIDPGNKAALFFYGQDAYTDSNFTMILWTMFTNPDTTITGTSNYNVPSVLFQPNASTKNFWPIDPLNHTGADLSLTFVINKGYYKAPINDPFFSAHVPYISEGYIPGQNTTLYTADAPIAIGCTERVQICSVPTGKCSPLAGTNVQATDILTPRQHSISKRIARTLIPAVNTRLSQYGLLADDYCRGAFCLPLPDNQWEMEFQRYFSTSLVMAQKFSTAFVSGPGSSIYEQHWVSPPEEDRWMCDNQIIIRDDYSCFSILGIALVVGIGGLIILTELLLSLLRTKMKSRNKTRFGREWDLTSFFQLQRMAFESRGEGTWVRRDKEIPIVEKECFARFSSADDSVHSTRVTSASTKSFGYAPVMMSSEEHDNMLGSRTTST